MALTEPLGTGMFVTNVVVGLIILATPLRKVAVCRISFLKDCLFFLGAVLGVMVLILIGEVHKWQVLLPAAYYVLYIIVTLVVAQGSEPLHADPRQHEIPHFRTTSFLDNVFVAEAAAEVAQEMQLQKERSLQQQQPTQQRVCICTPLATQPLLVVECKEGETPLSSPSGPLLLGAAASAEVLVEDLEQGAGAAANAGTAKQAHSNAAASRHSLEASLTPFANAASQGSGLPRREGGTCSADALKEPLLDSHGKPELHLDWGRMARWPIKALMSFTMPLVSNREGSGAKYRKVYAVCLPVVLPLTVAVYWLGFNPFTAAWSGDIALLLCAGYCLLMSLALLVWYPRDGRLRGPLLGVCTVVAFLGSMIWMQFAAEEVVAVTLAMGTIFNINSSLLAATFVSWAGAAGDTINNLALTRDGFPTMALTACFSSPLFVNMGGLTCTLLYFCSGGSGTVTLPGGEALLVLYVSCAVMVLIWVLLIPLVFRYKLTSKTAYTAFTMYLIFQLLYVYDSLSSST